MSRLRLGRVIAFIGSLLVAAWLGLIAVVLAADLVAKTLREPLRSITGLLILAAFLALAVVVVELLRRKILPRITRY
ncbi:hypothetical protein MA03_07500 [Infirmifilum uzonense]|uniref:Uncharacterized protein n=1 Tax=Infirmifilum uzonense TaxID=1550241 RepID=A0A0F7FJC5_9CREN|nr:hypothetical protein MA03_07500 [Infirmifilum uzonense]